MHLVPLNVLSDIDFGKPRLVFSPEEFAEIARAIREA
jgi:hypothetical protein